MSMQNFNSLACNHAGLDTFLTIIEENVRIFQENSLANSIKFQTLLPHFILNLAKHVHAKFQLPSFYPDGLRQIFEFLKKILGFFRKTL
jgi:hypothetical protein